MLINPVKEHGVVYRREDIPYSYQGWPSLVRTDDGRLISVCSGYRMAHVCPFGKTVMNISDDEGQTWSAPVIINDSPLDDRDAGIVDLGHGRLLVSWFVHPAERMENLYYEGIRRDLSPEEWEIARAQIETYKRFDEERRKGGSYVILSDDGGKTWSQRIRVPVTAPHGPALLNDGNLLYLGKEHCSYGLLEPGAIAAYTSANGGRTWELLSKIQLPAEAATANFSEPHAIELPGGRVFGAIRAEGDGVYHNFTIYTCYSDDRGKTWSIPKPVNISGSPPHLMLHSSGALIMSFGRREEPFGERALVSFDGGETWPEEYIIDDRAAGGDLGYPASAELGNGSIFTLYYQRQPDGKGGYDKKTSILSTRWRLGGHK